MKNFGEFLENKYNIKKDEERRKFCFVHDDRPIAGGFLFPAGLLTVEINLCEECCVNPSDYAKKVIADQLDIYIEACNIVYGSE